MWLEVLVVELTPPDIAARGLRGLRGVKVLVPGMLPIDFRPAVPRLGGPRLYAAPGRRGCRGCADEPRALDPAPYPFP